MVGGFLFIGSDYSGRWFGVYFAVVVAGGGGGGGVAVGATDLAG